VQNLSATNFESKRVGDKLLCTGNSHIVATFTEYYVAENIADTIQKKLYIPEISLKLNNTIFKLQSIQYIFKIPSIILY